jgi:hypothetical protein
MSDDNRSRDIMSLAANPRGQRNSAKQRITNDFDQAHRRAFVQDTLALIRYEPVDLLPFEEVREKLQLGHKSYLGPQEVPLDQIVGSVGRYEDFTRTFMPRKASTRPRWENIDSLMDSGGWPLVELYKVSDTYFVRDGNHRVSVARQLGMETIEAEVWEYASRVPLEPDDWLDDIILRQEYLEFLENTELDRLRPDQWIILTLPGGYWELEESIAIHRHWHNRERSASEPEMTWPEAVADWYDQVYLPLATKVQESDILSFFPGRTEADLVVWILRHWEKLEREYGGEDIPPGEVVDDFVERTRANPFRHVLAWVERNILGKPVDKD